jgi:hydroxymethylbilane synthase
VTDHANAAAEFAADLRERGAADLIDAAREGADEGEAKRQTDGA